MVAKLTGTQAVPFLPFQPSPSWTFSPQFVLPYQAAFILGLNLFINTRVIPLLGLRRELGLRQGCTSLRLELSYFSLLPHLAK
jgi:hypothetical protein